MGLDMYAYRTKNKINSAVDFTVKSAEEIFYWRKHPDLHGWMEQLYRKKAGSAGEFNCANLLLTAADLDQLGKAVKDCSLPKTSGFFFGESCKSDALADILFINKARQAVGEGYSVYYHPWW